MKKIRLLFTLFLLVGIVLSAFPVKAEAAEKVFRYDVVYDPISVPVRTLKKTPVYKTDLVTRKQVGSEKISIERNTEITLTGEKNINGKKWFKVSFLYDKNTVKGYVKNNYVVLANPSAVSAKIIGSPKGRAFRIEAEEEDEITSDDNRVMLADGAAVSVLSETAVGTVKWYLVSFTYGGEKMNGYIRPKYVQLKKKKRKVKVYPLTEEEFEEEMNRQKVPEMYRSYLRTLHKQYPFWEYRMYDTGLKWKTALKEESKIGVNHIPNSKSAAWKSKDPAAYDSKTGKWKILEGSSWVAPSEEAVAYYMDPRNFLNERTIFQVELQEYQKKYQTATEVEQVLSNTPFGKKKFSYTDPDTGKKAKITYANAFIVAAAKSNVSPIHLASRVKQEVVTSATTTSGAVTGKNSQYPGIYNFYNIGAYSGSNPMVNGLKWASEGTTWLRPWTDRYRSLVGGAQYIGTGYINNGQNTIYLEKFDVTPYERYNHQYMANVEACVSEAIKIKNAYTEYGLLEKTPLVFSIPVYKDMPEEPCAAPK